MNIGSDRLTCTYQLWDEPEDRRIALCRAFYEHVYRDAFPKREQAEEPETWLPLMSPPTPSGKPHVYMILACASASEVKAEAVVGGIIFEHYRRSGFWLATYIAVHPTLRGQGVAADLFARMKSAIAERAPSPHWHLVAEAENPLRLHGEERVPAYRRLSFLTRLGLQRLPINYVQPPLAPDKPPCRDLLLLCDPRPDGSGATADGIVEFLCEFYGALDQPDAPELQRMLKFLKKPSDIAPIPLQIPAHYDGNSWSRRCHDAADDLRLPSPASSGWKRARRPLWGRNSAGRIATRPPQLARLTSRLASAFGPVQLVSRGHYHSVRLRQQPSCSSAMRTLSSPVQQATWCLCTARGSDRLPLRVEDGVGGQSTKSHFFPRRRSTVESPCQLRGHRRYLRERLSHLLRRSRVPVRSSRASADQHRRYSDLGIGC